MASSSGHNISDYEAVLESLNEITKKDAQMADERAKLLNALTTLTKRYEELLSEQNKLKKQHEGEHDLQSALAAALETQNGLLRGMVEEKEEEITQLEQEIVRLKAGNNVEEARAEGSGVKNAVKKSKTAVTVAKVQAKVAEEEEENIDEILQDAARDGRTAEVEASIARGAKVNAKGWFGFTPLMYASIDGHLQVLEVLIAHGAKLNAKNNDGKTALFLATSNDHVPIVRALITSGADVNVGSKNDGTALKCALRKNNQKMIALLKSAGAKKA